ncbi:MAG: glycosyltransferase family 2 protein [Nitrospinae bacterium]|nr:glycosyltransferase family 2 protein [Nitrospinota bacterium]
MEDLFHISNLRLLGALTGAVAIYCAIRKLRSYSDSRASVSALGGFGIVILLVSLFPSLVNIPAGVIGERGQPSGRIITLLVISVLFLFVALIDERGKREKLAAQFDRLVRKLAMDRFMSMEDLAPMERAVIIVMPAYNEVENIAQVLPRIPGMVLGLPLITLVVDDGSADGTGDSARALGARVISNVTNRGGGASIRLGLDAAKAMANDGAVVIMDADGQHQPEELETLVAPALAGVADMVVGSRILGARESDSAIRLAGVHFFSALLSLLTGFKITDCSSGYRALRMDALRKMDLRQDQFWAAEQLLEAGKRGLKHTERPITITRRISGVSKKGTNLVYGFNFMRSIVKTWIR